MPNVEIRPTYRPSALEETPDAVVAPPEDALPGSMPPAEVEQSPQGGGFGADGFGPPMPPEQAGAAAPAEDGFGAPQPPESPIDYKTGGHFGLRVGMQRADNPEEARLLMEQVFGKENVGQDKKGNWFYRKDGKRIAVHPDEAEGTLSRIARDLGPLASSAPMLGPIPLKALAGVTEMINKIAPRLPESIVASAAPFAGTAAGGVAGTALAGPPGGMLGSGLGYVAGKSIDELAKAAQGFHSKDMAQEAHAIAGPEAAINMLMPAPSPAKELIKKKFFGVTPQSSRMAEDVLEEGATPPIGHVATEAKGLEMKRQLSTAVSGDMHRETNVKWLESQIGKFLEESGIPAAEARKIMDEAWRGASAVDGRSAAQSIIDAATRQHGMLQSVAEKHLGDAKRVTDAFEQTLRAYGKQAPETMGQEIGQTLVGARQRFGQEMKSAYKAATQLTGDAEVVPIDGAIEAAKQIIKTTPAANVPPFITEVAALPLGTRLTLEKAHDFRTFARESERAMTQGGNATPGTQYHYFDALEKGFDNGISQVSLHTKGDVGDFLKRVDKQYAEGITTFKNGIVRGLINDIQRGQVPQPYVVARDILEKGSLQDVVAVKRHLKPEQQEQVAQAFVDNLLRASSTAVDDQSTRMVLNPNTLLKNLEQYDDVMKQFMSPKFRTELSEFANTLRVTDGKLDPEFLRQGPLRQKLAEWQAAKGELDKFVQDNPLAAFRSGNEAAKDQALSFITNPGHKARIEPFIQSLSPGERQEVQKYVITRMFGDVMETSAERAKEVKGDAIRSWLGRYTQDQLDAMMGYGVANDLARLGEKIAFVFPSKALEAGQSQAAVSVLNKGFFHPLALHKRMRWYMTNLIVHEPAVLRWFADISDKNPTAARVAGGMLGRWLVNSAMEGPGTGKPKPAPVVRTE